MCGIKLWETDLSELADVSNPFSFQRDEFLGDSAPLQVDNSRKGFVQQRTNRLNGKATSLGLYGRE